MKAAKKSYQMPKAINPTVVKVNTLVHFCLMLIHNFNPHPFKTKYRKTIKERAQTNPLYSKFRKNELGEING